MSRLQREALIIVMDVGANTQVASGKDGGKTFFERSKECVKKIILRKLLTKPADEIGIVLFGADETKNDLNVSQLGFHHIVEMDTMQVATWEMLKAVEKMKPGEYSCSWIDALLVAINFTRNETEAKKFSKIRIILLTNFQTETDDEDVEVILQNIINGSIELIGVSDTVAYETSNTQFSSCQFTQNPNKGAKQTNSEKIFQQMAGRLEEANLCHIDYVESQLVHYAKKTTRSMPWNASLTIGGKLSMNISAYVFIQDEKFFGGFKTECLDHMTATKMVTEYTRNNQAIEKPDEDDVIKAYMYGTKLIAIDDPDLVYRGGSKCLSCLAFCKRDKVPQEYFIGDGCHIVVPQRGFEKSSLLFSALVQAMDARKFLMIARKVYRDNLKPQIVALIPKIDEDTHYLMMYELPYSEDIVYYTFPSLKSKSTEPSAEQMATMQQLVTLMDLTDAVDDESGITEAFTQDSMLNPFHQNMCASFAFRALRPGEPLPSIDEALLKLIDTPEKIKERLSDFMTELEAAFPRKIVDRKEKKPPGQIAEAKEVNVEDFDIFSELDSDQRSIVAVGSVTPAEDFCYLMKKGEVRFNVLCEQIQSIIYEYIFKSCTEMADKIKETIMAYRLMASANGPFQYNKWIGELKASMIKRDKIDEWNKYIVREGFGLISRNESPLSEISIDDQIAFYEAIPKESSRNLTATATEDDDLEALL